MVEQTLTTESRMTHFPQTEQWEAFTLGRRGAVLGVKLCLSQTAGGQCPLQEFRGKLDRRKEWESLSCTCSPLSPWVPSCWVAFKFVQGQAVRGIIHLPVPFSISSSVAGTFWPPLKHKTPSERNIETISPPPLWITNAVQEGDLGGAAETGAGARERGWASISENGKQMSNKRREDTRREMSERGGDRALFSPGSVRWRWGPRRELRLIGSFGLEKWISPPKKRVSF